MFNVNFNNLNSFYDLGLIVERRPIVPIPEKNVNQIIVPGRNGSLTEDEETYNDIEIPIEFAFVDMNNLYASAGNIKQWLRGNISDNKLVMSDDMDHYYKVKSIKMDNIERFMIVVGKFTATFICEPFLYARDNDAIVLTSAVDLTGISSKYNSHDPADLAIYDLNKDGIIDIFDIVLASKGLLGTISIFNPGNYWSEPYIKITGVGDINLSINDIIVNLKGVTDYIEIDSGIGECYKYSTPLNTKMNGEFPIFQPGENVITWTGNVSKVEITPNWRWI